METVKEEITNENKKLISCSVDNFRMSSSHEYYRYSFGNCVIECKICPFVTRTVNDIRHHVEVIHSEDWQNYQVKILKKNLFVLLIFVIFNRRNMELDSSSKPWKDAECAKCQSWTSISIRDATS